MAHPPLPKQKKKKNIDCASPSMNDNMSMGGALDMSGMMGSSLLGGISPGDFCMGYVPPFMVETDNKEVQADMDSYEMEAKLAAK